MQQKLFTGSSPNLPPLPNCLHSGNLQKGVKAITEIPSLFLLPFSSSAYISFRNRSKGLEHAIFWAPKHITFSPPEVARNLVLLKNSSRQNYNFYHIFSYHFCFLKNDKEKGISFWFARRLHLAVCRNSTQMFAQNIWCREDLETICLTGKDFSLHL